MRQSPLLLLLACSVTAFAADPEPVPAPAPVPPTADAGPWKLEGRLGAFFNNTETKNADDSLDPTIGGAARSTAVLGTLDGKALWSEGKNSVDHLVKGRYGRVQNEDGGWIENEDEARYDGVYRREMVKPHFVYLSWTVETVWTGPYNDPTLAPTNSHNPFDPLQARAAGGYGQRYANWFPDDTFEWRIGSRVQKRWGSHLREDQRGIENGVEAFVRYDATPLRWRKDLKYFFQYEGFAEYNDLQHLSNLVTAGLTFQFSKYINLELALRAYYETRPKEDRDEKALPGYNQWSIKQDTLIGVVYSF